MEKYVPSKAVVFPNLFGRWESLALARVQPQNRGRGAKTVSSNGQFWPPSNPLWSPAPQTLKCSNSNIPQRCSDAQILGCCNTRMLKRSLNIQMLRSCKEARVFRCSDVQMLKCLDAQCALHICSDPARTNYSTLCFITAAGNFGNFATAVEE